MWYSMSRTGGTYDTPHECPLCGSEIQDPVARETNTAGSPMGPKSPDVELVVCPDCDEVIDGFCAH